MYVSDAHWSIISVNTGWRYILGSHYTPTIYQGWFSGERGIKLVGSWDGVKGYVSTFMTTCCPLVIFVYFYLFIKNEIIKYQSINLLNWCNMTFTADNLFPSHSCIGWQSQAPTGIRPRVPSLRGGWLTNWAIPPLCPLIMLIFNFI